MDSDHHSSEESPDPQEFPDLPINSHEVETETVAQFTEFQHVDPDGQELHDLGPHDDSQPVIKSVDDGPPTSLSRGIKSWHVTLISLGGIIGSCYFLGLGLTFAEMGAIPVLIGYFIAGVCVFGVMQSFSELLVNLPRHGSFVAYNREFLGDAISTGIGWSFWVNWVVYVPSECLAFSTFMNTYYTIPFKNPAWSDFVWGCICLVLLTLINLFKVKWFGHVESAMAIAKILVIVFFVVVAFFIWVGVIGKKQHPFTDTEVGFIGGKVITEGEGSLAHRLFPNGYAILITYMIYVLVNFQGSEIVGLSAAETEDPKKNIPAACKKVATRIIMIYIIPILCLIMIVPHHKASLDESIFAYALSSYGLKWAGQLFTFVTLVAAFSCANSGLYGTVRCIYGLSKEGLAPAFLSKLNKYAAPFNATIFTLVFIWIVFIFGFLSQTMGVFGKGSSSLYGSLLGISGFTGTLMWVGIIISQIVFRIKLKRRGYDPKKDLDHQAFLYPYLNIFSVVVQIAAMICMIFSHGGWVIFLISLVIFIIAVVAFLILKKCGKINTNIKYAEEEILFDAKYPQKTDESESLHISTGSSASQTDNKQMPDPELVGYELK
ncbi:Amino acid permease family protein [Trichomonas vaginalis G3]|uniref:Amino acid permease family protein n=1 Tax=Trichomonas vaginalis (strain ATCC PRA-98 / G3) TaxID=412133 RepID=A2F3S7_TRIV3|nr:amino acid permease family [Trichomonas vaginalis G3]EAY00449.1 Amino acid permease family protein [Trichomonas vaginalis G3]KAI5493483.1 amino acid permease family [Trichomonas vaginalis G3]|eukprot:XP_001313378.1 Amino acid permease family protein [Trichomonas vaginalis G3]